MSISRRRTTALASVLAAVLVAVAALAGGAGASPRAKQLTNITIAVGPDPSYAPWIMAAQKGIFQKYGLNPELKYFSNGGDMNDALVAGQLQFSGAGTGTLLPRLSTKKAALIAVTATSGTTFAMAAQKSLTTPRDFVGKKLGVVQGTTPEYVWKLFLQKNGISPSQVQMVYASPPELTTALAQGRIDALYLWQPWPFKATQLSSNVHIYQHSKDVSYLLYFDATGNVDWMNAHPTETVDFLKALKEGVAYVNAHRDETVSALADIMHQPLDATASQTADYAYKLAMPTRPMILDAHAEGTWLARGHKLNTRIMPWKSAFETQYLAKVLHVQPVSAVLAKKQAKKHAKQK